jgi:anti-sigma B factor antagonist
VAEVDPRHIEGEDCMEDRPQFRVDLLRPSESVAVVDVEGEVDIYSAPQFKEVLLQGIEEGASRIIVDLAKVTFIDSTALGVLVSGAKRIFEITGLDRIFGIYPTRENALSVTAS